MTQWEYRGKTMTQWEYKGIDVGPHGLAISDLNDYGSEGWELVSLAPNPDGSNDPYYIFKRPSEKRK